MTFAVTSHLNFCGEARDVLVFYGRAFGAEPVLVSYAMAGQGDAGRAPDDIVWGEVASADGIRVMAYDVQADRAFDAGANAFYVSLRGTTADEVQARWGALAEGAEILQPLGPSAWSPLYGMLRDRFGITWIIDVAPSS